jgi:glycosyltransferase involved in cell wall biosynthesis
VSSARYKTYPDIAACYAALFPRARRVYVSPDIASSSSSNPYLRLLYRDLAGSSLGEPVSLSARFPLVPLAERATGVRGVWHQHWLQCSSLPTLMRAAHRLRAMQLYRALGGHVLWTVHNLEPHVHKYALANTWLTRAMRDTAEYLHVHTEAAADQVSRAFRIAPERIVIVPHPSYEVARIDRRQARAALEQHYGIALGEARTFLIFGMLARYKQVAPAIRAFDELDPARVQLVIAGALRGNEADYEHEITAALGRGPVQLCERFIPDEHVGWFFGAADVVLFNYRQILTSGAIQLARDYGKPIWIPDLPALAELTGDELVRFKDEGDLRARLLTSCR